MDYEAELDAAIEAGAAGIEAMADYRGDHRVADGTESKENVNDLVTAADRASQDAILDVLGERFPDDTIVGEEGTGESVTESGREWIVDPIDGTANFATGFPYYCVSIALAVDGTSQVGVVVSPPAALDRLWYGVRGEGVFVHDGVAGIGGVEDLDGLSLSVTEQDELPGAFVFGRLSERHAGRRQIDWDVASEILDRDSKFRRVGSAALNLCQVASGHADGYVVLSLQEGDVAAGPLLVEGAGGTVRKRPARVEDDSNAVVASNGQLQAELEEIVDETVK